MNRGYRFGFHTGAGRGRPSPELVSGLIHRVKVTYHSRLETARRLESRSGTWNFLLIASALVSAISGVVQVIEPAVYGSKGAALFALLAILTMATSLLVASGNYGVRALLYFRAYRSLQRLWAELDADRDMSTEQFAAYEAAYQQMLDEVPNHTQADYYTAHRPRLNTKRARDNKTEDTVRLLSPRQWLFAHARVTVSYAFTYLPVLLGLLVILALGPTVQWFMNG